MHAALPIVHRLRDAAAALPDERVSMRALAQAHGPNAHGALLLLMALPCLLPVPGVGSVLGLGMAALAAAMWRGHSASCLPERVAELEISRLWARRVLTLLACTYSVAGRHARARMGHLVSAEKRSAAPLTVGLMAALIVLPIPFGNVLPALAITLIGLGLVFRDGLAAVLGQAVAGLALLVTAGLTVTAWAWGNKWLTGLGLV